MILGILFAILAAAQLGALIWGLRLWQRQRQASTLLLLLPLLAFFIAALILALTNLLPSNMLPTAVLQLARYGALTALCPFGILGMLELLRRLDVRWARKPLARTLTWLVLLLAFGLGGWGVATERLAVDANPPWQVVMLLIGLAVATAVASIYFWRKLNWVWLTACAVLLLLGVTSDLWLDSLVATAAGLVFTIGLNGSLTRMQQAQNVLSNLRERRRF